MDVIESFPPVYRTDARILVLGTMPSVASLREGFYYAHPRNAFWRIIAEIANKPTPTDIDGKKELLYDMRIALWDVARSCVREGSLDSNIKREEPNDIMGLLKKCPEIKRVILNGGFARTLFNRHIGTVDGISPATLPSTSPAYTLSYDKKLDAWRKAVTLEEYNERG